MPEGELRDTLTAPLKPFEEARLSLLRLGLRHNTELERSLWAAARICAESVQVRRVGIWIFEGDKALRNIVTYDETRPGVLSGELFDLTSCPVYHAAIRSRRVVAVRDARNDPKTAEMKESYLIPLGITSMMDVPIYADGDIIGVICCEHSGPCREWSEGDCDFAASVADIISSLFQQARHLLTEEEVSRMKERLAQAEQMHALARLAAGVAHDLNNLLSIILLNAGMLPPSPQARMIEEQCQAGSRLVRQLLAFARDNPPEEERVDIRDLVGHMETLLVSALGSGIKLVLRLGNIPLEVRLNRGEFEQVMLNLAFNARDAMKRQGGAFEVEASLERDDVVLRVSDTGEGMNSETLRRAFEPFFTTRRDQGGTGMGLAIVYGAMRRARGQVVVESQPGQGTTFELRWPRAK
ncbi:MAG: ATP-binding protein [Myxococcales bacterium]|nr:ATP-binding protein [Polyangiaceae bacterium]MDW8251542.1 ATP-binding protein [Myxococcales bacterium]